MNKIPGVRVDKWLWAIRLFKSRTISTDSCKAGKVMLGALTLKPSHEIRVGDLVFVYKEGFKLQIKVIELLEKRLSATLAKAYYENLTPEEELNKYKSWYIGKSAAEVRDKGLGRPTKRERRDIDDYKENFTENQDEPWLDDGPE